MNLEMFAAIVTTIYTLAAWFLDNYVYEHRWKL